MPLGSDGADHVSHLWDCLLTPLSATYHLPFTIASTCLSFPWACDAILPNKHEILFSCTCLDGHGWVGFVWCLLCLFAFWAFFVLVLHRFHTCLPFLCLFSLFMCISFLFSASHLVGMHFYLRSPTSCLPTCTAHAA